MPIAIQYAEHAPDGVLNLFDLTAYQTRYNAPGYEVLADWDLNGARDFFDFTGFQSAYLSTPSVGRGILSNYGHRFGYAGYWYVPERGLYHVRNRWYDPEDGRWLTRDPAGYVDGASLYGYVAQQPLNALDPMGLWGWDRDLIQYGIPGLLGFHGRESAAAGWNEYSEATYGVVGTLTGGPIDEDYGFLGYKDEVLDAVGHDDSGAFDSGKWGGRAAVAALLAVAARHAASGHEYCFGRNLRIAPWGNRTGHPTGRFPHCHRRIVDGHGNTIPGGGIGRHRPWDAPGGGGPRW